MINNKINNNKIKCRYCGSIYCVKYGKKSINKERYSYNNHFFSNDTLK